MDMVGSGHAHLGNPTVIQVKRLSFNDDDLAKVLQLQPELEAVGSPIGILDLTGTSVTDQGVGQLEKITSLEYCYLSKTRITDAALESLKSLPKLKVLQVDATGVTTQALAKLSETRPQLDISPHPPTVK